MKNEGYIGKNDESETMSADDRKVSDLLGGLKRIDAPKNFDFRLKNRIANTRPEDLRLRRLLPMLGYAAAPLALVLATGTYFVFTGVYSIDNNSVSSVQEVQPIASTSEIAPVNPPARIETAAPIASNPVQAESRKEKTTAVADRGPVASRAPRKVRLAVDRPGGSYVTGQGISKVINPKGENTNSNFAARIPIREILSTIGINADFEGGTIKVRSVVQNNMAGRSGIAAGDVLETINGQPVTGATMFDSPYTVTSIGVRRDGKLLQIDLR